MQQMGVVQTGRDHHSQFGCVAFGVVAVSSSPGQKAAPRTTEPLASEEAKIKRLTAALPGDRERSAPQKWGAGFARKRSSWVVGRGCQEARPNVSQSL